MIMNNIDAVRAIVDQLAKIPKPRYLVLTPDGQILATDFPLWDERVLEDRHAGDVADDHWASRDEDAPIDNDGPIPEWGF